MLREHYRIKKGQVVLEFTLLVGIAMFTLITFLGVVMYHTQHLNELEDLKNIEDVANKAQRELNLAAYVSDGYSRSFTLPDTLYGEDYTITIYEDLLVVSVEDNTISKRISSVVGSIQKGANTITKEGGVINVSYTP